MRLAKFNAELGQGLQNKMSRRDDLLDQQIAHTIK